MDIGKLQSQSDDSSDFRWSETSDSSSDIGSNAIVEYNAKSNELEERSSMYHERAIKDPQLNGDGEVITSKPSSGHGKRFVGGSAFNEQKDLRHVKPSSGFEMDLDDVHINRGAIAHMNLLVPLRNERYVENPGLVDSNDSGNLASLGEERLNECDERPIYQVALQNLNEPKLEDDLPEGFLSVTLLMHQRVALAWMVQKEKSIHCAGGILADDQGLGKTLSMIALLQSKFISSNSQHSEPEALNLDDDDDGVTELDTEKQLVEDGPKRKHVHYTSIYAPGNWRPAAGTLVVCPASVVR